MDVLTPEQRKHCMAAIRNKDTQPEMLVRRLVHSLGFRFRLHVKELPGKPDLVFSSKRKVIYVHGCFWHRHSCKKGISTPVTQQDFWREKLNGNKQRDRRNRRALAKLGWKALVVWECETSPARLDHLAKKVVAFLQA